MSLTPCGGSLTPAGGSLSYPRDSGGGTVLVEKPAVGYWIDGSGYPALNGIYRRQSPDATTGATTAAPSLLSEEHASAAEPETLRYRHLSSGAGLIFHPQGWLLCLADGTDCFLQAPASPLMVKSIGWMAIDGPDNDPLADPPDEVVALLDEQVLADVIAAQRAHEERIHRARVALLPPSKPTGEFWKVVHRPAAIVRDRPSVQAAKLGLKLHGELVWGVLVRGGWLQVHAPVPEAAEGWMLIDGRTLGLGMLLERVGCPALCFERDAWVSRVQPEPPNEPSLSRQLAHAVPSIRSLLTTE